MMCLTRKEYEHETNFIRYFNHRSVAWRTRGLRHDSGGHHADAHNARAYHSCTYNTCTHNTRAYDTCAHYAGSYNAGRHRPRFGSGLFCLCRIAPFLHLSRL